MNGVSTCRSAKTLVLFPPFMSQLYVFPHLSVPVLTGYLRKRGIDAHQRDFNLEYIHHAVDSGVLLRIAERRRQTFMANRSRRTTSARSSDFGAWLEARFLAENWPQIRFDISYARRL